MLRQFLQRSTLHVWFLSRKTQGDQGTHFLYPACCMTEPNWDKTAFQNISLLSLFTSSIFDQNGSFFFLGLLFPVRLNWETVVKCPCKAFFFFYGVTQPKVGVVFAISLRKTLFTFLWCTAEDEIHLRLI